MTLLSELHRLQLHHTGSAGFCGPKPQPGCKTTRPQTTNDSNSPQIQTCYQPGPTRSYLDCVLQNRRINLFLVRLHGCRTFEKIKLCPWWQQPCSQQTDQLTNLPSLCTPQRKHNHGMTGVKYTGLIATTPQLKKTFLSNGLSEKPPQYSNCSASKHQTKENQKTVIYPGAVATSTLDRSKPSASTGAPQSPPQTALHSAHTHFQAQLI